MELLTSDNPNESLVILPDKHANIGRFFNGINNNKKQSNSCNIRTIKCQVPL